MSYKIIENNIEYEIFEFSSDTKVWMMKNKIHRELGEAVQYRHGHCIWYWYGERLPCRSQEEFEQFKKLKAFW